jgi:peroxiredoxin Q/BCP
MNFPMNLFKTLLLTAGLALTVAPAARLVAAEPPKVGDPAPDFQLPGSDGKTYKLSEFKGKTAVVVAWFPKAFTGG